ncbi:hypothetical protein ACJJTC_004453 [Scirpophaga incertulas]
MEENDDKLPSSSGTDIGPSKAKTYVQKFKTSWLENPDFKHWLKRSDKGETKAYCKFFKEKCNIQEADNEWRQQALVEVNYFEVNSDEEITKLSAEVYWKKVLNLKDHHGNYKYQNLEVVISLLLALPSSNTEVERLFSVLKNVKSDKRNKLSNETLNGLLHTKLGMTGSILEPDSAMMNAVKKLKASASASTSESYCSPSTSHE